MVDAITPNVSQIATESRAQASRAKFGEDFDDFLNLLLVQLQNQDPTQPLDTNEFTQQIVQLNTVEQSISTNDNLEKLVGLYERTNTSNIVSWTGKLVEVEGSRVQVTETGAKFAYELEEKVSNAFVQIFDNSGKTVFAGEGSKIVGRNTVNWDGLDNSGNPVPPGTYNVRVSVRKEDDNIEEITTYVGGRVDGVNLAGESPTLLVNDEEIPLEDVNFIGSPS